MKIESTINIEQSIKEVKPITKEIIQQLRGALLTSPYDMLQIGNLLGVDRQTVGRRTSRKSIPLDEFLELAIAIGVDPIEIIERVYTKHMNNLTNEQ